MGETPSDRRLAENEVLFRKANQRVEESLRHLRQTAKAEGFDDIYSKHDHKGETALHFYCECADEKCRERIVLTPSKYKQLHTSKTRFVVKLGHEVPAIERVVRSEKRYIIVDKFITPPDTSDTLHPTDLDNTAG